MIDLGISATRLEQFEATLRESHDIRIKVAILDRNEKVLGALQPQVLTGAVQVDANQDVTRSLSITCLDPNHKLTFDGNSPASGALFADNFAAVTYGVHVKRAGYDFWVDVPVFTGPLTGFERVGPEVTIEAQGKESLGLDPHQVVHGYTIPRGTTVANAIRNVMGRLGEQKFKLGMISGKLTKHRSVASQLSPWTVCVGGGEDAAGKPVPGLITKAGGHFYLFYDGEGYLTAKHRVAKSKWTFGGGDLVSQPTVRYDVLSARNHVEVTGGTPRHSKKHYRGSATLPAGHPLSPAALARNNKPRYLTTFYSSDNLKSDAACRAKAKQLLDGSEGVTASFDSLVIPHLEEWDTVALKLDNVSLTWPVCQFTIPLTADASMSIGFNKSIKPSKKG